MHSARHLASDAHKVADSLRRRGREVWPLRRRGADLGQVVSVHRELPQGRTAKAAWAAGEPIFLPGVLGDAPERNHRQIQDTLGMFDRLRAGADFLEEVEARIHDDANLRYAGSTVDQSDPREVERIFVNAEVRDELVAEDLWAKLAWITATEADQSLRIRFSNGLDQQEEWLATNDQTASWVDQFALRTFPECRAVLQAAELRRRLDELIPRPYRLSERIIYNNAPDGGAVFHHDAEPSQLGVVFSQLEGRTAWFTMAKPRLARLLVRFGMPSIRHALLAMDSGCDEAVAEILNRDPDFAALLAANGGLFLLRAGDAIVLPSPSFHDCAWHSVLAVGDRPSLAHSYGVFARQPDYESAGDPWLASRACSTTSRQ